MARESTRKLLYVCHLVPSDSDAPRSTGLNMRLAATVTTIALLAAIAAYAPSALAVSPLTLGVPSPAGPPVPRPTVPTTGGVKIAAFGDAFTAGFGFDSRGRQLSRAELHRCHAQGAYQRCSSNGSRGSALFSPDHGLRNRVSYAAELMHELNRGRPGGAAPSRYRNVALSASLPRDWAPGGRHHGRLRAIARFRPHAVVASLGWSTGHCVGTTVPVCTATAADPKVKGHINATLRWLVRNTQATIVMVGYAAHEGATSGPAGNAAGICRTCGPHGMAPDSANATLSAAVNEVKSGLSQRARARLVLVLPRPLAGNRRIAANRVHPNAAGHADIADQVRAAVTRPAPIAPASR
jgi:hypothetical protein